MIPNIYIASDHVLLETLKFKAYYGHELVDYDGQWCFAVWKNGKEVFWKSNSELLEVACGESPEALFIAGLGMYLCK